MMMGSYHPSFVAKRYTKAMNEAYQALIRMEPYVVNSVRLAEAAWNIRNKDMAIREFLYEESLTKSAHRDEHGQIVIDNAFLTSIEVMDTSTIAIKNVPYWWVTFGGVVGNQFPAQRFEDPGFIGRNSFWTSFMETLKEQYGERAEAHTVPAIPSPMPEYTKLVVVFRQGEISDERTMNHFLPPLESIVNAFRHVDFLMNDGPGHLWIETRWEREPTLRNPLVDFIVYGYSDPLS